MARLDIEGVVRWPDVILARGAAVRMESLRANFEIWTRNENMRESSTNLGLGGTPGDRVWDGEVAVVGWRDVPTGGLPSTTIKRNVVVSRT